MKIDINADLGEGYGPYVIADDAGLMGIISSANIACGYHAGDPVVMDRTIALAKAAGVEIGAHVGYPDRMGFGRRAIAMDPAELEAHVLYQLGALDGLARRHGMRITHMNPHGALGNLASVDAVVAEALVRATSAFDREIAYLVMSGSAMEAAAVAAGRRVASVFLADRAYTADGQLAPRAMPGAVLHDADAVVARLSKVLADGTVEAIDGGTVRVAVQSVLVHSDTPGALDLAAAVRSAIIAAGATPAPLSEIAR
ncbi:LamB/YcsF family protein [Acuticoccus kandeliae]|uniref:LamB/YcsF family protein n=1 Tax=Acuticoccus kandeliae TaxID=2073160 RepID=UPI000D3E273E|nr:5-oxoprolinase subunit PxpA [Acuticoccus kandeliae]